MINNSAANSDLSFAGKKSMNGLRLNDYKEFYRKWNLVTVRHREDTGEFRFVYANPIAWKVLQNGKGEFPEGSVLAKIGFDLDHDPLFASSLVPTQVKRYQLMVKDTKKFKETDGWGYGLYDSSGLTMAGDPHYVSQSCHACHKLAVSRGYVFAEIARFGGHLWSESKPKSDLFAKLVFENLPSAQLPEAAKKQVPAEFANVRSLKSEMSKKMFFGTINEIVPSLCREMNRSHLPAILISDDQKQFSMIKPKSEPNFSCPKGKQAATFVYTEPNPEGFHVMEQHLCFDSF